MADPTRLPQVPPSHFDETEHRRLLANAINALMRAPVFIAPTLLNSWANVPGEDAGYYKDPLGRVHLRGRVASGVSATILTLPEGYRPSMNLVFAVNSSGVDVHGRVDVQPDGDVVAAALDETSLSGISFAAV